MRFAADYIGKNFVSYSGFPPRPTGRHRLSSGPARQDRGMRFLRGDSGEPWTRPHHRPRAAEALDNPADSRLRPDGIRPAPLGPC